MTYVAMGPGALDYQPCRYGTSKLLFRGPKRTLDKPYVAFIGGTETYGRFIEKPFAALVEEETGQRCVNFGCLNAGIDVFARDPYVPQAASEAVITVVQVMGAQNMSNRFYSVHPRRNDRFLAPSDLLKTIFREIDFSEFHFNKHLLTTLRQASPDRFDAIYKELQSAWVTRMRLLVENMQGKVILLWFANHQPAETILPINGLGDDPLFVTRSMMAQVAPYVAQVVEVIPSALAQEDGTEGMVFAPLEALVAKEFPGPRAHAEAAAAVVQAMSEIT
ncbi:hypothetical protein SAMN04488040_3433 [Sulfitobacter marinus]|uniref:DUF6473 domain-containing protein n=1 Tax=Sulfitobacter marinus TaxID=394264 RepID=A0A1I6VLA1_9RHOB|nr:DUF6473 family protein [Sulfitobacter marinus]SFT14483.1 hypothetical protein SAMN04488040_3433 [Sulfitobacter marinus]